MKFWCYSKYYADLYEMLLMLFFKESVMEVTVINGKFEV